MAPHFLSAPSILTNDSVVNICSPSQLPAVSAQAAVCGRGAAPRHRAQFATARAPDCKQRRLFIIPHFFGRNSNKGGAAPGQPDDEAARRGRAGDSSKQEVLLNYVRDVQPQLMEQFSQQAPAHIVSAMRQTITNMLGTLPPQFFQVRVLCVPFEVVP